MVTLRHAFDANSMKGLVLKILRGNYPPIPSNYSKELNEIIADMLIKDPAKRPSMRKILEKDFLARRITKLLTSTIAKNEFSNTFVTKHLAPYQDQQSPETESQQTLNTIKKQEESKDGESSVERA
jgi:NIMA (never in mitosis gene a)-related kinase 1/4/5